MAGRQDPYRNFRFSVTVAGQLSGAFQKVSGIKKNVEVVEYREGDDPPWTRKMTGQQSFDNVTLERGFVEANGELWEWMELTEQSEGANTKADAKDGVPAEYAKDIIIEAKNKLGTVVRTWTLKSAFPVEYTVGDLDASSNDVLINTVSFAYEEMLDSGTVVA